MPQRKAEAGSGLLCSARRADGVDDDFGRSGDRSGSPGGKAKVGCPQRGWGAGRARERKDQSMLKSTCSCFASCEQCQRTTKSMFTGCNWTCDIGTRKRPSTIRLRTHTANRGNESLVLAVNNTRSSESFVHQAAFHSAPQGLGILRNALRKVPSALDKRMAESTRSKQPKTTNLRYCTT